MIFPLIVGGESVLDTSAHETVAADCNLLRGCELIASDLRDARHLRASANPRRARPVNLPFSDQEATLARTLEGFFDSVWYTARYPDVAQAGIDPFLHFIRFGMEEKRDPNRFFDSAWYLASNPDVQASGTHPLLHYMSLGAAELRHPHPRFDAAWYVHEYPDAASNPLLYHVRVGLARGHLTEKPLVISDYLPSARPALAIPIDVCADVIIPVYKGLNETRRCLESVLASKDSVLAEIIVVDDHSPDRKLSAWLDTLAASGRIRLVRNRRNQGFVRSVNAGMSAAGDHDVVLLNSNAEVPAGWLERLAGQAYAAPRIATVSPLSNNASTCGYPADGGGPVAFGKTAGEIDALCRTVNAGRFVQTPTTEGFCMYIRREALTEAGDFDAERFGLGYGAENDFCLRAAAHGWRHHIACDTFVYHRGSVSVGARARARALTKGASDLICQQHPNYARDIAGHVKLEAIGPFRWAVTAAALKSTGLPVLLMVSHGLGGGVRRHIDTLVAGLDGRAHVLLLQSAVRGASLSVPALSGHPALNLSSERLDDLVKILRHCGVGRVHVHHLLGMGLDIRAMIHRLSVPFDLTVHDYYAICPQVNLLPAPTQLYCNEPAVAECNACIAARPSYGARDILSWRAERAWQFHEAERVFCPSQDVLSRLERYGLADNAVLASHEAIGEAPWPIAAVSPGAAKLRIAVLGVLADHKGARTVAELAEACDPKTTEIHLIGHTEDNFPRPALKRMKITGAFEETALAGLIESVAPHVIWFPVAWPETFSYTLSAAIASGRPIAAADIGAFGERLRGRPFTWLADHRSSAAEWIALFHTIRAALPAESVTATTAMPGAVNDVYAKDYLRPLGTFRPARRRPSRPVIAVVPERYDNGQPTPSAYIRLLQPLDHPSINGDFEVRLADAKSVLSIKADIIATQRHALPDARSVEALAAHAQRTGAWLLYDLDDNLLDIARSHPEAEQLGPKKPTIRRILAAADAVWVPTQALADRIARVACDVTIVRNGLDERIWAAQPHRAAPVWPARLLCMGAMTHEREFAMIAPALIRLKEEFGSDVEIDLLGMTGSADIPPGINRIVVPHHATLSYPGFVHWLTSALPGWHVGLAPLVDTPFNRSKSALQVMDYAALGLGVLASDIPVYRGSIASGPAGQLVTNEARAWYLALNWLVRDHTLRLSMAAAARTAFLATSSLAVQAEERRDAWLRLLRKSESTPG